MRDASSCSSAANVEHLIMTGVPLDVLIQTEIEGHGQA